MKRKQEKEDKREMGEDHLVENNRQTAGLKCQQDSPAEIACWLVCTRTLREQRQATLLLVYLFI